MLLSDLSPLARREFENSSWHAVVVVGAMEPLRAPGVFMALPTSMSFFARDPLKIEMTCLSKSSARE